MAKDDKSLRALNNIARPSNRSSLFWWMLEHHEGIVEAAAGRRMHWKQFCADARAMGLTDTAGKPVTEENARLTWWRVRREKARLDAGRETAAQPRRMQPSRLPASTPAPLAPVPAPQPPPAPWQPPERTPDAVESALSEEERWALENERGPDGLLTDAAVARRRARVEGFMDDADRWMGLAPKKEG